jgi:hypothetical protein
MVVSNETFQLLQQVLLVLRGEKPAVSVVFKVVVTRNKEH